MKPLSNDSFGYMRMYFGKSGIVLLKWFNDLASIIDNGLHIHNISV